VVVDCHGLRLSRNLDPRVGLGFAGLLKSAFRGRLRLGVVIDPGPLFGVLCHAFAPVLPAQTKDKIRIGSGAQALHWLREVSGQSVADAVAEQMRVNRAPGHQLRSVRQPSELDGGPQPQCCPSAMWAAARANRFEATAEWQPVPDGVALPPGLEVQIDMREGKNWARLPPAKGAQARAPCPSPGRSALGRAGIRQVELPSSPSLAPSPRLRVAAMARAPRVALAVLGALALASAPWLLFCGATILLRTGAMNKIPQAPADSIVLDASELVQHVEEIAGEPNTDVAAERHAAGLPQDVEDEEVEEAEEVGNLAAGMMTSTSVLPQIAEEIVMNPASTRQQGSLPCSRSRLPASCQM